MSSAAQAMAHSLPSSTTDCRQISGQYRLRKLGFLGVQFSITAISVSTLLRVFMDDLLTPCRLWAVGRSWG